MAGQTSDLGYWEYLNPNSLKSDEPLSAGKAWRTVNNLNHLRDVSTQYRLNYMGGTGTKDKIRFEGDGYAVFYFPWQCTPDGMPYGIDLRLAYADINAGSTTTGTAYIMPHHVDDLEPDVNSRLFKVTGSGVTGTTASYDIDTYALFTAAQPKIRAIFQSSKITETGFETADTTKPQAAQLYLLKMTVKLTSDDGSTPGSQLYGVQLKEYA